MHGLTATALTAFLPRPGAARADDGVRRTQGMRGLLRDLKGESMIAVRPLALLMLLTGAAHAADGFESVRCGGGVRAALLGHKMSNEAVAQIEARHTALGLKDLGGDEISDTLNSTSWRICAKEYVLLTDAHDTVRDVLPFPAHSKATPEFSAAECEGVAGPIVGVMDRGRVAAAWRIDEKAAKFVPLATEGLACPGASIVTADGGR
jgi:hypothetical protein